MGRKFMKAYDWGEAREPVDRLAAYGMSGKLSGEVARIERFIAETKLRLQQNRKEKEGARRPHCIQLAEQQVHLRRRKRLKRAIVKQHSGRTPEIGWAKLGAKRRLTQRVQTETVPVRIAYPNLVKAMWLRLAHPKRKFKNSSSASWSGSTKSSKDVAAAAY
jgi:hypothetical protein